MDNATSIAMLVTAVIGAVEAIQALFDKNYRITATIMTSALVGGFLAPHIGLDWLNGVYLGLSGSGVVTVAKRVSN